jgi:uncharacterized protein (DUF58 family)
VSGAGAGPAWTRALATLLLGVGLCLSGAIFDSPSLYVPGVTLGVLALGSVLWVRLSARGASLMRLPGPHTVVEDELWPLRVEIRLPLIPPPGGELHEPLLGWPVPIGGRWLRRVRINVRFGRRGRRRLEPNMLVIHDPLRLDTCKVPGPGGDEILVLPRVEPVTAAGGGGGGAGDGLAGGADRGLAGRRLDGAAELEIDGLRPYREGSPASRIHWPAVARTGEMIERRLTADVDSAPLVVLDPTRPASEEALDMAVRAAASLCVHLGRAGGCAVLLPGDRRPVEIGKDMGAWPAVHARLALVEADAGVPAMARAPRGGAVFWVTATAAHRIPRTLDRLTAAARYLVTPSPLPGYRAAFGVAGCTGQLLDRARGAGRRVPAARGSRRRAA